MKAKEVQQKKVEKRTRKENQESTPMKAKKVTLRKA
jgi:hypothetical protein